MPRGTVVSTARDAVAAFRQIGGPVVVKPLCGHRGENVSVELSDAGEVAAAFRAAAADGGRALVEAY